MLAGLRVVKWVTQVGGNSNNDHWGHGKAAFLRWPDGDDGFTAGDPKRLGHPTALRANGQRQNRHSGCRVLNNTAVLRRFTFLHIEKHQACESIQVQAFVITTSPPDL